MAVHESGHALVAALSPTRRPGGEGDHPARGHGARRHHQLPAGRTPPVRRGLPDTTCSRSRLGGRAAELVVFGHGSTGAANDLAEATNLAIRMVREFGLSPRSARSATPTRVASTSAARIQDGLRRPYSEETQRVVDQEVSRLLREAEERAVAMLNEQPRPAGLAGCAAGREGDRGRQRRPGGAPHQEAARPPGQRGLARGAQLARRPGARPPDDSWTLQAAPPRARCRP